MKKFNTKKVAFFTVSAAVAATALANDYHRQRNSDGSVTMYNCQNACISNPDGSVEDSGGGWVLSGCVRGCPGDNSVPGEP